ncbi:MAG: HDIG domain-containing protein [Clostridiales bacterium]|jgi:putative nucleotidyltransferase with HDIG domain|nr:HDIG domain-containing protein [Clostridiales bacterium]
MSKEKRRAGASAADTAEENGENTALAPKKDKRARAQFFKALGLNAAVSCVLTLFYAFAVRGGFGTGWDRESITEVITVFFVLTLVYILLFAYEKYFAEALKGNSIKPFAVSLLISAATVGASLAFMKYVSVFFVPIAFLFLLCAALVGLRTAIFNLFTTALALCFIVLNNNGVYDVNGAICGILCNTFTGALMIFASGKNGKRVDILFYNVFFGFIAAAISTVYATLSYEFSTENALWLFASVVASVAVFWLLLPVFDKIFDVCTDFRIFEYTNPANPVLKELKEKAPGTYHHSIMVASLAEACAEAVGENPLLARASAYYHDIGKIKAPEFFGENQFDGYNPHDELIPEVSASKIIAHTKNGVQILKEKGFPEEIVRAAEEHHGTSPVNFFYNKAKYMTEGGLESTDYVYDNHKPTTKISAILMICDTVESAVRANQSADTEALIAKLIKDKIDMGQFNECDISLKDIEIIKKTLVESIPHMFHSRVRYQTEKKE